MADDGGNACKGKLQVSHMQAANINVGGGMIAKYVANHNIDTVDIGVPVLSMHSALEVIAKKDLYETLKAFKALE